MVSTTGAGGLSATEKLTFADNQAHRRRAVLVRKGMTQKTRDSSSRALCFRALRPGPYAAS
jgi:hypothetical protein